LYEAETKTAQKSELNAEIFDDNVCTPKRTICLWTNQYKKTV